MRQKSKLSPGVGILNVDRQPRRAPASSEPPSDQLHIPLVECVTKTRDTAQLKDIFDLDTRLKALDGVHAVDAASRTDLVDISRGRPHLKSGASLPWFKQEIASGSRADRKPK
jgi:hypothetical protein